jgi:hypothetical protein
VWGGAKEDMLVDENVWKETEVRVISGSFGLKTLGWKR